MVGVKLKVGSGVEVLVGVAVGDAAISVAVGVKLEVGSGVEVLVGVVVGVEVFVGVKVIVGVAVGFDTPVVKDQV